MPAPTLPAQSTPQRWVAYLMVVTAIASWGINWAVARSVHAEVTAFALTFWRWAIAIAILLPFALRHALADFPAVRASWKWIVFYGISGAAAFSILGYLGVHHTTAINASLLNACLPLFMIPLAWLLRGHTVRLIQFAGLLLSLSGAVAIISAGDVRALLSLHFNPGDLLVLTAAALWSLYTVHLDHRPAIHPLSLILYSALVAIVITLPFYGWEWMAGITTPLTIKTVSVIGYLALFPSVVAYICWNHAVRVLGPNTVGFFYPLTPVFGTLGAVVLLGEPLQRFHLAGFALVLGGLVLTARR